MSEAAALRSVPPTDVARGAPEWSSESRDIVVGKDILELLSSSMYVDPMTIYREYAQNSADAIDEAHRTGCLPIKEPGRVDITINAVSRIIRILDNGTGLAWHEFVQRLSNLGASRKRGTQARGFRGVGRLAGLGYCQELIFRSRVPSERLVSEMRWDCRLLKTALRSAENKQNLGEIVKSIVTTRRTPSTAYPDHFFEVELIGVIRHRDDRLLNAVAVGDYLSQVAPVPFSPEFTFGVEIQAALTGHVNLANLQIRINGSDNPLYRPHRNSFLINEIAQDKTTELEIKALNDVDGNVAAIAWVAHHGYYGALPNKTLIKGIRLRSGNVQVGDHALLESMFPESRFNAWAIGEVHIIDKKVLPNGRRDHFEHSSHFDNLLNQLTPLIREIARRCRDSSIARKWIREFELQKTAILEDTKVIRRGALNKQAFKSRADSVAKALKSVDKIVATRHIDEDTRQALSKQATALHAGVVKALGAQASEIDPLDQFPPTERKAYQNIISLIYDCTSNRAAAISLVEKLLSRLGHQRGSAKAPKKAPGIGKARPRNEKKAAQRSRRSKT
jgi:Histidine kinase-, DNA gyrase B-, and HSP90-like ATPase